VLESGELGVVVLEWEWEYGVRSVMKVIVVVTVTDTETVSNLLSLGSTKRKTLQHQRPIAVAHVCVGHLDGSLVDHRRWSRWRRGKRVRDGDWR